MQGSLLYAAGSFCYRKNHAIVAWLGCKKATAPEYKKYRGGNDLLFAV